MLKCHLLSHHQALKWYHVLRGNATAKSGLRHHENSKNSAASQCVERRMYAVIVGPLPQRVARFGRKLVVLRALCIVAFMCAFFSGMTPLAPESLRFPAPSAHWCP